MSPMLKHMLSRAVRDKPAPVQAGRPARKLIHGMAIRLLPTHIDRRGTVFEMFDKRWNWHPEPVEFAYCFTVRPGVVKGWGLHREHEDRYCIINGRVDLVLFDPRETSPTFGQVCRVQMSEYDRCIISIPTDVWHADHNVGQDEAVIVNFPTKPYDHANPDKYRLPIDTDLIPYDFGVAFGG